MPLSRFSAAVFMCSSAFAILSAVHSLPGSQLHLHTAAWQTSFSSSDNLSISMAAHMLLK